MKIIIADDHKLFADGVEYVLLNATQPYEVIAKVSNGKLLMQVLNSKTPDVVLLDISMPYMDGVTTAINIKKNTPNIRIVVISMVQDLNILQQLKEVGVEAYIGKDVESAELLEIIQRVYNGQHYYALENGLPLNEPESDIVPTELLQYKLTNREMEIIRLVAKGYNIKKIAEELCISNFTVDTHHKNIARKIGTHTFADLVHFAHKMGV